jgi:ribulose bisphosphate carboxylase small subunit
MSEKQLKALLKASFKIGVECSEMSEKEQLNSFNKFYNLISETMELENILRK